MQFWKHALVSIESDSSESIGDGIHVDIAERQEPDPVIPIERAAHQKAL